MKVYLAAPYGAREQVNTLCGMLDAHGFVPTSTWAYGKRKITDGTVHAAPALTDAEVDEFARDDLNQVAQSHALVVLTESVSELAYGGVSSGGRHVETGFALAREIPVIVWGEPDNIFHRSSLVRRVGTWDKVLEALVTHRKWLPVEL